MQTAAAPRRLMLVGAAALALVGLAAAGLLLRSPDAAPGRGPTLTIAVVAPPPSAAIVAGEVMDVGGVIDGYVHRDAQPSEPIDGWAEPGEDYWAPEPVRPTPVVPAAVTPLASPDALVRARGDSLGLGFDPVATPASAPPPLPSAPPDRMPSAAPPVATGTGDRGALFY